MMIKMQKHRRIPMKCLRERIFNFNFVRQMTTTTTTMYEEFLIICINSRFILRRAENGEK